TDSTGLGRARFCSVLSHAVPEYTSGTLAPQSTGRRRAVSPLPVGFSFQRTTFCLAQASAVSGWEQGVLPRPIPSWLTLCRIAESCCCSRFDPRKPPEVF